MWDALANSGFAQWLTASRWAYPTLLTIHGLGMAVVVGLTVMASLRVLGFPPRVPLAAYIKTVPLAVVAFFLNAASGIALFVADASTLTRNPSFIVKLVAIAIGLVVLWRFYKGPLLGSVRQAEGNDLAYVSTTADKTLAVLAILIWASAVIVSGRLIAYLAPEF